MIWHNPAALAALALVAAPVIVHLLVRRHATRVVFPGMRFVPAVRAAAVRLRAPSDRSLLLLRMAIVAAAALAVAEPVLTTSARERAWERRVARAVIVDTSASVPAADAGRLADAAMRGAFVAHRFAVPDLRDGLRRAGEWLAAAPAARREIVVVSDFQRGSIDQAAISAVPVSTGVALLRAGQPRAAGRAAVVDGWRGAQWEPSLALDAASTQVTWTRRAEASSAALTVHAAAADRPAADRAAAAARSFGVPRIDPPPPIDVEFAGAPASRDTPPVTPWIASAAMALRDGEMLAETAAQVDVRERDGTMIVKAALPASSPLAPLVIRAALLAAAPRVVDREGETSAIDEQTLSHWRRDPAPIASTGSGPDESDGRWFWALALTLLLVEEILRRRGVSSREGEGSSSARRATGGAHADAA